MHPLKLSSMTLTKLFTKCYGFSRDLTGFDGFFPSSQLYISALSKRVGAIQGNLLPVFEAADSAQSPKYKAGALGDVEIQRMNDSAILLSRSCLR
jgi:hypothetical protein